MKDDLVIMQGVMQDCVYEFVMNDKIDDLLEEVFKGWYYVMFQFLFYVFIVYDFKFIFGLIFVKKINNIIYF